MLAVIPPVTCVRRPNTADIRGLPTDKSIIIINIVNIFRLKNSKRLQKKLGATFYRTL